MSSMAHVVLEKLYSDEVIIRPCISASMKIVSLPVIASFVGWLE